MLTLLNLFGKSPFHPLLTHMDMVSVCVHKIPALFNALKEEDFEKVHVLAEEISRLEHKADLVKNDIRNHLPKSLLLSIDRGHLLEILSIQDSIADQAEDVAVLLTFKDLRLPKELQPDFDKFLQKNIDTFDGVNAVMHELHDLMESSYGGGEAEKVHEMVLSIAEQEHQADLLQRTLTKKLIQCENEMSFTTFYLWQKVNTAVANFSNLAEKLANRVRMTLELK